MASSRGLRSPFKEAAEALLAAAREEDPRFRITSGLRSQADQAALYKRWERGDPGVISPALPGTSKHELGWAVDIARPGVDPWDDDVLWDLGELWEEGGGVWGGNEDPVHFEAPRAMVAAGPEEKPYRRIRGHFELTPESVQEASRRLVGFFAPGLEDILGP